MLNSINESLDADPSYMYLYHENMESNDINTLNVQLQEGILKQYIGLKGTE